MKSRHLNLFLSDSSSLAHCSFTSNLIGLLIEPPYLPSSFLSLVFSSHHPFLQPFPDFTPLSMFCAFFAAMLSAASRCSSITNSSLLTIQITQVVSHMPSAASIAHDNYIYISSISVPNEQGCFFILFCFILFYPSRTCIGFSYSTSWNIGKTMYMSICKTFVCFYRKYPKMIIGDMY